jgi:hypothetical protein
MCLSLCWNNADWGYVRRKSHGEYLELKFDREMEQNTESDRTDW